MSGGVQSIYSKYTVGSRGIWEKIRRFLALDPNRSSGVPINAKFRIPSPASVNPYEYDDPVTIPAGDIASNRYWQRDNRRNYPALSIVTQQDVVGLLELGSKVAPRIAAGEAGQKQLVEVKQGSVVLAEVLKQKSKNSQLVEKEILGQDGMPPLLGQGMIWVIDDDEGYPSDYPCRSFKYRRKKDFGLE